MSEESESLRLLRERFEGALVLAEEVGDELRLTVRPEAFAVLCLFLRDEPLFVFDYPADLMARDTGGNFALWGRLVSMSRGRTAILRTAVTYDDAVVPSITAIYPGMDWHERECFDLFGIRFTGHPDDGDPARMRILMPEDWIGHPFRRDYEPVYENDPLHGPQERN